jgi:hypothetical protein
MAIRGVQDQSTHSGTSRNILQPVTPLPGNTLIPLASSLLLSSLPGMSALMALFRGDITRRRKANLMDLHDNLAKAKHPASHSDQPIPDAHQSTSDKRLGTPIENESSPDLGNGGDGIAAAFSRLEFLPCFQ